MRIVLFINFTSGLFLLVMYEANKSFSTLSKCVDEIPSSPLKSRPEKFTIVSGDTKAEALENFRNDWCKGKSVAQMEVELTVIGEGT